MMTETIGRGRGIRNRLCLIEGLVSKVEITERVRNSLVFYDQRLGKSFFFVHLCPEAYFLTRTILDKWRGGVMIIFPEEAIV
jgi:hypothetical protein